MKTLADLKREAKNYTWRLRHNSWFKESDSNKLDYPRKVSHANSVGIGLMLNDNRISYLDWPRSMELIIIPLGKNNYRLEITRKNSPPYEDKPAHVMIYELNPLA